MCHKCPFCCNGLHAATAKSILAIQPSSAAIQRGSSLRIHLTARAIITRPYGEASVMFRTWITVNGYIKYNFQASQWI